MTEDPSAGKRSKEAPTVIWRIHKRGTEAGPLRGLFAAPVDGRQTVVEYEPDQLQALLLQGRDRRGCWKGIRAEIWRWRGRRKGCWERLLVPATSGRRLHDRNHLQSHRQNEVARARGRGPRRFNELLTIARVAGPATGMAG